MTEIIRNAAYVLTTFAILAIVIALVETWTNRRHR